ncbi:MAG: FliH/SctL family protein [Anaerocolumna sp.]
MTRLLSNVIKSRFIYVNDEEKKIIDSNERSEIFRLINLDKQFNDSSIRSETAAAAEADSGAFTEGIKVTVIDRVSSEEQDESAKLQSEQIMEEAKDQAAQILLAAEQEAKKVSESIYEEARNKGYQDGIQKSISEVQEKKNELNQLTDMQNEDYLARINSLEPQFADIVAMLIEKLTGILVEDKKDVINYLIHNAILNADNSKYYIIRASKDDYVFVLSKKKELADLVNEEITIDIILDKELNKNQCLIETDTGIVDCSLDVQLCNLIQDIKLLSN